MATLAAAAWSLTSQSAHGLPTLSKRAARSDIVLGRSIRGVGLGMTRHAVELKLGPGRCVLAKHVCFYNHFDVSFDARFAHVTFVFTQAARDRTSAGIRVGSSERRLLAAYPKATCNINPEPGGRTVNGTCSITGRFRGLITETEFSIGSPGAGMGTAVTSIAVYHPAS